MVGKAVSKLPFDLLKRCWMLPFLLIEKDGHKNISFARQTLNSPGLALRPALQDVQQAMLGQPSCVLNSVKSFLFQHSGGGIQWGVTVDDLQPHFAGIIHGVARPAGLAIKIANEP